MKRITGPPVHALALMKMMKVGSEDGGGIAHNDGYHSGAIGKATEAHGR